MPWLHKEVILTSARVVNVRCQGLHRQSRHGLVRLHTIAFDMWFASDSRGPEQILGYMWWVCKAACSKPHDHMLKTCCKLCVVEIED